MSNLSDELEALVEKLYGRHEPSDADIELIVQAARTLSYIASRNAAPNTETMGCCDHLYWYSRLVSDIQMVARGEDIRSQQARDQRIADRIDGYDRDDLGESPDY